MDYINQMVDEMSQNLMGFRLSISTDNDRDHWVSSLSKSFMFHNIILSTSWRPNTAWIRQKEDNKTEKWANTGLNW